MGILSWIVLGLIAGSLAKLIMPGDDPGGCIVTILLGVAGEFVGGLIGSQLGFGKVTEFDLRSLGVAVVGSIILLLGYRFLMKRK